MTFLIVSFNYLIKTFLIVSFNYLINTSPYLFLFFSPNYAGFSFFSFSLSLFWFFVLLLLSFFSVFSFPPPLTFQISYRKSPSSQAPRPSSGEWLPSARGERARLQAARKRRAVTRCPIHQDSLSLSTLISRARVNQDKVGAGPSGAAGESMRL